MFTDSSSAWLPQSDAEDQTASDLAVVLFETATLRSGYQLADTKAYGDRIERMLRLSMNVDLSEQVCLLPPVYYTVVALLTVSGEGHVSLSFFLVFSEADLLLSSCGPL